MRKWSSFWISPKKVSVHDPNVERSGDRRLLIKLVTIVSVSAFLFGYDQGVIGGITVDSRWLRDFQPGSPWLVGFVTSCSNLGAIIGSLISGVVSDKVGREQMMAHSSVVFIVGAVLQTSSYGVAQMIIGRFILGAAIGTVSVECTLYIAEISEADNRGQMIGLQQVLLNLGSMVAYFANYGFAHLETNHWWRITTSIYAGFAVVLAWFCYSWVLPSPRCLAMQARSEEALEVFIRLHGTKEGSFEMELLTKQLQLEKSMDRVYWKDLFKKPLLKITLNGIMTLFFQQATGGNSILYYAPLLFQKGGITDPNAANLCSGGVGILMFVTSLLPVWLFERLGRRTWLTIGSIAFICSLTGVIVCQWHVENYPPTDGNYALIVFIYLFFLFFNPTWACGGWTYACEIYPIRMRSKGNAISIITCWATIFAVSQLTPVITESISWGLYVIFIGFNIAALVFVRLVMIETRSITLEEMSAKFGTTYEAL